MVIVAAWICCDYRMHPHAMGSDLFFLCNRTSANVVRCDNLIPAVIRHWFEGNLPSGRHETLLIPEPFNVEDLRILAKKAFGQGFLKLVTGQGDILQDPRRSLTMVGAPEGDHLTAIA